MSGPKKRRRASPRPASSPPTRKFTNPAAAKRRWTRLSLLFSVSVCRRRQALFPIGCFPPSRAAARLLRVCIPFPENRGKIWHGRM